MAHVESTPTGNGPQEQLTQEQIWDDSTLISTWDAALAEYKKFHSLAAKGEDVDALLAAAEKEEEKARETARRIREGLPAAPAEEAPQPQNEQGRQEEQDTVMEEVVEMGDAAAAAEVAAGREEERGEEKNEEGEGKWEEEGKQTGNRMLDKLRGAMATDETAAKTEAAASQPVEKEAVPVVEETNGAREEGEVALDASMPAAPSFGIPDVPAAGASAQGMPVIGGCKSPLSDLQRTVLTEDTADENLRNLMMSWYWAGYYTGLQEGRSGR